jgi:predicted ATP-binding protein involved in virulence
VEPVEGVNMYIGRNGQGKSTILDAAAIALSWFTARSANRNSNGKPIQARDIRNGHREASITIEVNIESDIVSWTVCGYKAGPETRKKSDFSRLNQYLDMHADTLSDAKTSLPVICYYPTTRAFVDVPKRIRKTHDFSERFMVYQDSLDRGADFRSFYEWYKDEEAAENAEARTTREYRSPILEGVRHAIEAFTGFSRLQVIYKPSIRMILAKGTEEIAVSQLSDGEQIYLALVGDLARRASIASGVVKTGETVIAGARGIVLIDEVELHLHPSWQREVLGRLRTIFPRLQFLVTTHSPQVVGEASRESSWMLDRVTGLSPLGIALGSSSDLILEALMETPSRNEDTKQQIGIVYRHIEAGQLELARRGLEALRSRIGEDPETTRLAAVIKRHEVLGK